MEKSNILSKIDECKTKVNDLRSLVGEIEMELYKLYPENPDKAIVSIDVPDDLKGEELTAFLKDNNIPEEDWKLNKEIYNLYSQIDELREYSETMGEQVYHSIRNKMIRKLSK